MEQEMEKRKEGTQEESEEEKWVNDGSVDYKGRVPFRSSTGVWKASLFVLTIEFSERVSNFGIGANLISYLTQVIHQDLKTAAQNVNYWTGTSTLMPLIGGFVADAYVGPFLMIMFSSLIYLMGLMLLTMSEFIPSLKPCKIEMCPKPRKIHQVVFFLGLYCISVGTGGYKPCLESFGADQFDSDHAEERKKKMSFFNWWNFALCFALLLGVTVIVYVEDNVGWGVANLILTITMGITIIAFYVGKPLYRYRSPKGNPFTSILQVIIAAIRKRNLKCPTNSGMLYEVKSQGRLLRHTSRLRFLDKAAIIEDKHAGQNENPWRLSTVTKVEETKIILNLIPIWLTALTSGISIAQGPTLFVKQAAATDLKLTDSFKIPPASVISAAAMGTIVTVTIYDKIIVPFLRKTTGNERGISILTRIGIGITSSVIVMVVAALVEKMRLGQKAAMSVFWLIPQNLILGFGDAFSLVGLQELFYDQVPDSMRSMGMALYISVIGVGSFLSSFLITVVNHVTGKNGKSWFGKDINSSRMDKFYWLLAAINGLNLCVYVLIARKYTYKNVVRSVVEIDDGKGDGVESMT